MIPLRNGFERTRDLHNETRSWIRDERQKKLRFHAATRVWQRILAVWENNGRASVGRMFELLEESVDSIDVNRATEIAEYWRDRREKEIDRIDREIRNTQSAKKIEGSARSDLGRKIDEAVTFSDRWSKLIAAQPDKKQKFHTKLASTLRSSVRKNANAALAEVDLLAIPMARRAKELIECYVAIFEDPAIDEPAPPMSLPDLLNGDLLANPNIVFDDTGQPFETPVNVDLLLHLANQDKPDFKNAAIERANRGDFLGAEAAIAFAERSRSLNGDGADSARAMVEAERTHIQQKFEDKVGETSDHLDAAYARGVLSLETFEQLRDKIPSNDSSSIKVFEPLFERLKQIDQGVNDAREDRREKVLQSLAKLKNTSQEHKKRVETALDDGRFQVADDFVERIERKEELPKPEAESNRPLDCFFPNFVEKYAAFRGETPDAFAQVRRAVENRERMGPIDAAQLSEDAARDGDHILEAWAVLRDSRPAKVDTLRALMSALGFKTAEVVRGSDDRIIGGERVFTLEATPVADRNIAQLPDFGSRARGCYRLLTIRDRATEEAIVREAGKRSADRRPPNIALFLSVLDIDLRRSLARAFSFGRHRPTLVLDEALIVFLAALSGESAQRVLRLRLGIRLCPTLRSGRGRSPA